MIENINSSVSAFIQAKPALERLFGKMSDEVFADLSKMLTQVHFQSDECIFREGEEGDSMYILVHGRLRVVVGIGSEIKTVAEIGKGECVGEMSLLTSKPRNASVFAIRDCDLIRMSKEAFEKITQIRPQVGLNLSRLLIKRFTEKKSKRPVRNVTNVAFIPLHESIDLQGAKMRLEAAIKNKKTYRVVSEKTVNDFFGKNLADTPGNYSPENAKLTRWLNELEEENDFVFYIGEPNASNWTKRCLRQADEILLVADSEQPYDLTDFEKEIFYNKNQKFSTAKQTLLFIHSPSVIMPEGTKNWLNKRERVDSHLHIRKWEAADYERLGRYLSNESVGLVLAGGGIKGMAHAGVVRAMEELNIPIDYVGGTSMGAVAGGAIGCGWSYDELHAVARELAAKKPSTDYNLLPFISFLKGGQLEDMLKKSFKNWEMEDCFINFYCVSANLTTSQPMVHRRGKLFDSVRASFSLPGVIPPKISPQGFLVDGGIVNNFPVDIMADMGVKTIIGVDFTGESSKLPDIESYPSGMQILGSKLTGSKKYKRIPTLMDTIVKSTLVNSNYKAKEAIELTDIYINPDTRKVGLLDWSATEIAVEAGYTAALEVLSREWKGF